MEQDFLDYCNSDSYYKATQLTPIAETLVYIHYPVHVCGMRS